MDDHLCIHIREKLSVHSARSSDCCIFRVPRHLRAVNKEAYEPIMVAIGPYHRSNINTHLKGMEEHKLQFLKLLLRRTGEDNLEKYIQVMRSMEGRARTFYAEDLSDFKTDEFVEMMLLDSCFIFELIRKVIMKALTGNNEPIFEASCVDSAAFRDLLLVENQLPSFVLLEFFDIIKMPNDDLNPFVTFTNMIDLLSSCMLQQNVNILNQQAQENFETIRNSSHLLGLLHNACLPTPREIEKKWEFMPSATRLKEAGIKFEKFGAQSDQVSLFDIKFEKAVLKIPILTVDDSTECFFRNLIAYEQFLGSGNSYFTDYARFMDRLIDSGEDVDLLCECGIIKNWLGDETVVADMFNKLRDNISCNSTNFYYSKLFNEVNKHCGRRCNKWMANLRHKYFNTPWALISLIAAILLLLLTLAQTLFSVLASFEL